MNLWRLSAGVVAEIKPKNTEEVLKMKYNTHETKCGGSPIVFAGFERGLWGISFGGPLSVMKVP